MLRQKEDKVNWWIFVSILLFSSVVFLYFWFNSEITKLKQDIDVRLTKQNKALQNNSENNSLIMQRIYNEELKRRELEGLVKQDDKTKKTLVNK